MSGGNGGGLWSIGMERKEEEAGGGGFSWLDARGI